MQDILSICIQAFMDSSGVLGVEDYFQRNCQEKNIKRRNEFTKIMQIKGEKYYEDYHAAIWE